MITLRSIYRYIKLKFKKEEVYFDGVCLQCGNCCRHIYLFTGRGKVIKTRKQFEKLVKEFPDSDRFEIVEDEGDALVFRCTWLGDDNKCKDHDNRLQLCKNYPAKVMYYTNFVTGENCGYTMKTGKPFSDVFNKALKEKNNR